jgi:hypothetical protein
MRFTVIALALAIDEEGNEPFIHSRNRKVYYRQLLLVEKRRRYRRLPRCALPLPCESSWRRVYVSQSDQALITLTGVDFATFHFIHDRFAMWFNNYTPFTKDGFIRLKKVGKGGRPRLMSSYDGLGLILTWTRTRGSQMVLQLMFGMTGTCTSDYLSFLMIILVRVLSKMDDARVKIPDDETINQYMDAVRRRHPNLGDVWCTMDGLKLTIEASSIDDEQNMFYNGWTCDHYVSAVFVFCPDGTIPVSCYNVPGSVHDSAIASMGGIYDKLEEVYLRTGGKCTVDSAFSRAEHPFLVKSGHEHPTMTLDEI